MGLLIVSFLAGVLTILAPCVLPLLPIILGAGASDIKNRKKPYIIILALAFSVLVFSLLLKATTVFIGVDPIVWKIFSGIILIGFGIITIFPNVWETITIKTGRANKSNKILSKNTEKKGILGDILIGFSLGPVFSSCSPTYAVILAVILPTSLAIGVINLLFYALGLAFVLSLIVLLGQKFVKGAKKVANPNAKFKKILGIIFILIGVAIVFGFDKTLESKILDTGYIGTLKFEQRILDRVNYTNSDKKVLDNNDIAMENKNYKEAYFAGGCFWCMEGIFEAQNGVKEAIVGYAGGTKETAKYDIVSRGTTKHREAVKVIYDPTKISYKQLVELFWSQIDPTDPDGQFSDKGFQYTTAILYENTEEKQIAEASKSMLQDSNKFNKKIVTSILPFETFFDAEEYHQDYYKKSSVRYKLYKKGSGREDFIEKNNAPDSSSSFYKEYTPDAVKNAKGNILLFFHADRCSTCKEFDTQIYELKNIDNVTILKVNYDNATDLKKKYAIRSQSTFVQIDNEGNMYKRFLGQTDINSILSNLIPYKEIMEKKLTPLQYEITQLGGTEKPFDNEYRDNHEEGIYVDIVDGTPLFSSLDKFDSGTGRPSFTKPIDSSLIEDTMDDSLGSTRTEIKSKNADSHLGHIFDDGPQDTGGKRYCINSAALKFIPVDQLKAKGYEEYLKLFK